MKDDMVDYVLQPCGMIGLIDSMSLVKKLVFNVIRACYNKNKPTGANMHM